MLGYTSLHRAAENGHAPTVKILLEHSACVHAKDSVGLTPLHRAVENGHTDTASILINHGADIHARSYVVSSVSGQVKLTDCYEGQSGEHVSDKAKEKGNIFAHTGLFFSC